MGLLKAASAGLRSARKGALFVSKQLIFDESLRQRRGRKRHKRLLRPGAHAVNRPCHQFLSGPAFSPNQHRRKDCRDFRDKFVDPLHILAVADHPRDVTERRQRPRCGQVAMQGRAHVGSIERELKFKHVKRLKEDVERALAHDLHGALTPAVPSKNEHRDRGGDAVSFFQEFLALESHWGFRFRPVPVEQNHVNVILLQSGDAIVNVRHVVQRVGRPQRGLEDDGEAVVRVDD